MTAIERNTAIPVAESYSIGVEHCLAEAIRLIARKIFKGKHPTFCVTFASGQSAVIVKYEVIPISRAEIDSARGCENMTAMQRQKDRLKRPRSIRRYRVVLIPKELGRTQLWGLVMNLGRYLAQGSKQKNQQHYVAVYAGPLGQKYGTDGLSYGAELLSRSLRIGSGYSSATLELAEATALQLK